MQQCPEERTASGRAATGLARAGSQAQPGGARRDARSLAPAAGRRGGAGRGGPRPARPSAPRRTAQDHIMALAGHALPMPHDVVMTDYHATAPDGEQIPMRWYAKKGSAPGSAVLYTHGGGMILGSMDLDDRPLAGYVSASGTPVLSVDYRPAPQHR